jgi:lipoyl(octanoyl) transferase
VSRTTTDPLDWTHLGRIRYAPALELQLARRDAVQAGTAPEAVFTLEHHPVITLGRRATDGDVIVPRDWLSARGIDVVEVDRGGEVTFHGPGQLVVYAVIDLNRRRLGPGDLVRHLAEAIREVVRGLGIESAYDPDRPGLWVDDAKLTAVGMRIQRGVSTHGAALNVTTDLDAFRWIVPCGLPGAAATSIASQGVTPPAIDTIAESIVTAFATRLDTSVRPLPAPHR